MLFSDITSERKLLQSNYNFQRKVLERSLQLKLFLVFATLPHHFVSLTHPIDELPILCHSLQIAVLYEDIS